MPVLRGAVTFSRFRAEPAQLPHKDPKRFLARALQSRSFEPIARESDEVRAAGWVELEDAQSVELTPSKFIYGEYALFAWRVDTLRVPASAVRAELEAWSTKFESNNGRPPSRSERRHEKDAVSQKLRARAFPTTRTYDVSWSLTRGTVEVWAATRKIVEEIQTAFEESFELKLHPLSPRALAEKMGVPEDSLTPTSELFGEAWAGGA